MHTIRWYREKTIILVEYRDYLDNAENLAVFEAVYDLLNQTDLAHVLVDFTQVRDFQVSTREHLAHDLVRKYYQHPALGWTVTIAGQHKYYFHLIGSVIEREFGVKREVVETFDQALQFIEKIHADSPDVAL